MKTLIVLIENYAIGGANKYSEDLINSVANSFEHIEIWGNSEAIKTINRSRISCEVTLKSINIFNTSELIKGHKKNQRVILRLLFFPFSFVINFLSLVKLSIKLRKIKPTKILLCNGGYPASLYLIYSCLFIKKQFQPTMTIVSTPTRKTSYLLSLYGNFLDLIVRKNSHSLVVNSHAIKKELVEHHNFEEEKIFIVRNGIADSIPLFRTQKTSLSIGFVSRVEIAKGIRELMSAFDKLHNIYPDIELIIAGDGSLKNEVFEFSKKYTNVKYLGHFAGNIQELLSTIDIFVLPSYQEGLPYSLIEAAMSNCALVASNVGGIPEIIKHNFSGMLIPSHNTDALYQALDYMISHPEKRIEMSNNARATFLNEFTLERMKKDSHFLTL